MRPNDTIVAISTPTGVGGIAVVRISGPDALPLVLQHLTVDRLEPRKATYCTFKINLRSLSIFNFQFSIQDFSSEYLDDLVAVYYPQGYTGEPTVELSCHGSLYIQQALLQLLVDDGARLAEPGEFTRRAFLNGRLDLSQAEAVADLIDSVTPAQHRLAVSQLRGGYAQELAALRQQLLDLTALLELELDFSQEDVEFADRSRLIQLVDDTRLRISALCGTFRLGNALKRGIPTAILGRPNAGKSSLLNALLADNRAIVSPIAGTTRDTVEETFNIDGVTFRLIDTAGLHSTDDPLESMGIDRAIAAAVQADIILFVHDATHPWTADNDLQPLRQSGVDLDGKHLFIIFNKMDLPEAVMQSCGEQSCVVAVSSKEGTGLGRLREAMVEAVNRDLNASGQTLLANARHYEALGRTAEALLQVAQALAAGTPTDLVAVDLRDALYHLGTVTGEVASDEVLGNIFGRFCIGK